MAKNSISTKIADAVMVTPENVPVQPAAQNIFQAVDRGHTMDIDTPSPPTPMHAAKIAVQHNDVPTAMSAMGFKGTGVHINAPIVKH